VGVKDNFARRGQATNGCDGARQFDPFNLDNVKVVGAQNLFQSLIEGGACQSLGHVGLATANKLKNPLAGGTKGGGNRPDASVLLQNRQVARRRRRFRQAQQRYAMSAA
jgi:hypothetical protein